MSTFLRWAEYGLYQAQQETYAYPVDGWYWFKAEAEARVSFNLPSSSDGQIEV